MAWLSRVLSVFVGAPDTAYGAALNITSVPSWRDVTGGKFRILSNRLISPDSSQQFLRALYYERSQSLRERDHQIIVDVEWDSAVDWNFQMRYRLTPLVSGGGGLEFYINLAGGIGVYYSVKGSAGESAGGAGNGVSGQASILVGNVSGLTNGSIYRFQFQVSGDNPAETVVLGPVSLVTGGVAGAPLAIFPGAATTYTYVVPSTSFTGDATIPLQVGDTFVDGTVIRNRGGKYSQVKLLTQGSSIPLGLGLWRIQPTKTSATIYHKPNGTNLPITVTAMRGGNHLAGSPATYTGTLLSFPIPGLTQDSDYSIDLSGTDSVGGTYGAALGFTTLCHTLPTAIDGLGIGDSITVGGSPQPIHVAVDYLAELFGITAPEAHAMGTAGYTGAQVAASIPDIVNVINAAGGNTQGATALKRIVWIRLGKNDHNVGAETNAEAAARSLASVASIVAAIRAGCAHHPIIFICPITSSGNSGPTSRIRLTNTAYATLENVADGIYYEGDFSFDAFGWNTKLLGDEIMSGAEAAPDYVHPDQSGINDVLGRRNADAYVQRVVLLQSASGSTPGGSVGGGSSSSIFAPNYFDFLKETDTTMPTFDDALPVVPSDTTAIPHFHEQAGIIVAVAGTVVVDTPDGTDRVLTFTETGLKGFFPLPVLKVKAASTATGIQILVKYKK